MALAAAIGRDAEELVHLFVSTAPDDLGPTARVADGRPQGSPELLRASVGAIRNLNFVRDGTFFYGLENLQSDSYVADFDPRTLRVTSRPKLISEQFVGSNGRAAWSPDGKSVAFLRTTVGEGRSVVIRSAATGEERSLPAGNEPRPHDSRLLWFPDNRHLLIPRSANKPMRRVRASCRRSDNGWK